MKKLLVLSVLFPAVCLADFAVIQDKDGFVNVRENPKIDAPISHKLKEGEVFYCFQELQGDFYEIKINDGNDDDKSYFIHKSRIRFISSFNKLKKTKQSSNQIYLNGFNYSINIGSKKFQKNEHTLVFTDRNQYILNSVDGNNKFWGTDGTIPYSEYSSLSVSYNGNKNALSKKQFGDLFNPTLENSKAYFDKQSSKLYLSLTNSDGAGVYHAVFVIKDGKVLSRFVVLDENV